ncbi:hypothetical protein [Photobacterium nomapromontoriensis]|uniref:hypothetical protein n=1 Tax=Photobacterium nomapromontoriensis TaxID=2910237 RepID=UPI003D130448
MSQVMNWYGIAEKLLSSQSDEGCKPFLDAYDKLKLGDICGAVSALDELNELQYYLSTIMLEIQLVELDGDVTQLPLFTQGLRENVPVGSVDTWGIYHDLIRIWEEKVGVLLPYDEVMYRNQYSNSDGTLQGVIYALCEQGMHEKAIPYAKASNTHNREYLAESWAKIIQGLADGEFKDRAICSLASLGALRPMIQDGGHEAAAYGTAIETFAAIRLDCNHPEVQRCYKGLLRLARHYAPRDARSGGTFCAAVAAARLAGKQNHEGWYEIAENLTKYIWSDDLNHRARVALELASCQMEKCSIENLKEHVELIGYAWSTIDDPVFILNQYVDSKSQQKQDADTELANAVKAGKDVSALVEQRMADEDRNNPYYTKEGNRFELGCKLCLPDDELEKLYSAIYPSWQKESLIKGVARGFNGQPERVLPYLIRGYPEGDEFGIYTKHLLPYLTNELLDKAEKFYIENERSEPLTLLAAYWFTNGDLQKATRIIGKLGEATSVEDWTPYYRRGLSSDKPFITIAEIESSKNELPFLGDVADIPSVIKTCKTAATLAEAVKKHWQDKAFVNAALKAAQLKKYQKTYDDRCDLIQLFVVAGKIDHAVALLPSVNKGKSKPGDGDYAVEPLKTILGYLHDYPEQITPELLASLLSEVAKVFPQYVWRLFFQLSRLSCRLPMASRTKLLTEILAVKRKVYSRHIDHVPFYLGVLKGTLEVEGYNENNKSDIKAWFMTLSDLVRKDSIYVSSLWIVSQYANLKFHLPEDIWQQWSVDVLTVLYRRELKGFIGQINALQLFEYAYRHLWSVNDDRIMSEFLQSGQLPQLLHAEICRSIWKDIHLAPDPFTVLIMTQPVQTSTDVMKQEFVEALSRVLIQENHPDADRLKDLIA